MCKHTQKHTCSSATGELSNNGGCVEGCVWACGRGCTGGRFCPLCLKEGNNRVHCNNPPWTMTHTDIHRQNQAVFHIWLCKCMYMHVFVCWRWATSNWQVESSVCQSVDQCGNKCVFIYLLLLSGVPPRLVVLCQQQLLVEHVHPLLPLDIQCGAHPQGCLMSWLGALTTRPIKH